MVSYAKQYLNILSKGLKVIIMAGEFDMRDGPRSQELWIKEALG